MFEIILTSNILASFFLAGLIWFVQIVHYPAFLKVKDDNFQPFHRYHVSRTGLVVIPPMIVEMGSSIWLTSIFERLWIYNAVGLALVTGIWISTFAIQIRLHRKLQKKNYQQFIPRLIASNWIRTVLWSAKAAVGGYLIFLII